MAMPGKVRDPPGVEDEGAAVGDHRAPGSGRRLHAEAEEGEARLQDDDVRHADRRDDDHRRQDVGQDLAQHDVAGEAPSARAASTYSSSRAASVSPRTTRQGMTHSL